ncbi:uncharacterized protein N0V89_007436 [Didymosphaeria variabile]|uniref:Uncharacterized protein n=1 Tax=Didymosphaeria variabile TaxID=1932322 RepID=A0A9W9CA66_9PLEO|nr:uncharacterized protein N0V89_007436 [Didymosphaeria variabile]KAJ4352090.1 hypothetical protein N0V89_007436 [Didymosphaeria variabile]
MRTRSVPKRKAPACTHVSMERIPLNVSEGFSCPSCGNYRALGFLYICRQERDMAYLEHHAADEPDANYSAKSPLRREMEHIGLSESVIVTAEQGLYTDQQLEKLKVKKTELNGVIAGALQAAPMREAIVHVSVNALEPPNNDGALNSLPEVVEDEVRPLEPTEANLLPIKSAQIMKHISCRPIPTTLCIPTDENTPSTLLVSSGFSDDSHSTPSQSSVYTYKTTQSEIDTLNTTRRHRRRFYKMGRRSSFDIGRDLSRELPLFSRRGLKEAFKGVFRTTARDSSSSGSNITLPMPHTAAARDSGNASAMGEFDMGALRRVKRQKDRFDLKQEHKHGDHTYGQNNPNYVLRRQFSSSGESDSSGSMHSVYSCVSEGSEVEVEGGVALTEEAVETHTPNIISDPESIMTQL